VHCLREALGWIEQSYQSGSELDVKNRAGQPPLTLASVRAALRVSGRPIHLLVRGVTTALAAPFHLAQEEFLEKAVEVYLKKTEITATAQWRAISIAQFVVTELVGRGNCQAGLIQRT
jgi:hypothetical protein